jgi:EmrB/QacA subfamily drug resistance transporter
MNQAAAPEHDVSARRWVLVVTSAAALLVGLDALVVSTAVTTIRADLGASSGQLGWMVNAYTLAFAVLLMPASALGDRYGRRRMFTLGVLVFAAASCGCAVASGPGLLIAARAFQGAGSAAIMPLALALLTAAFPPEQRAGALGVFAATTGISVPLGPLVGGAVVHGISWPWIFWLNVPLGLALALAARLRVAESETSRTRIDVAGLTLVAAGSLGVVWALVRADESGWTSPEIVTAFAVGVAGLAAFVLWERHTQGPMLALTLFENARFSAGAATIFFLWGSALGSVYFMAQFFQSAQGHDALGAGVRMAAWGATTVIVPRLVGRRIPRHGERIFIVTGMALHAGSLLWLAGVAGPARGYAWLVVPLVLSGAGCAMAIPAAQSLALSSVKGVEVGMAAGAFSMLRQLGGAAGVAAMVAGFTGFGSYAGASSFTGGFRAALVVGAGFAAVAGAVGTGLTFGIRPRSANPSDMSALAPVRAQELDPAAVSR